MRVDQTTSIPVPVRVQPIDPVSTVGIGTGSFPTDLIRDLHGLRLHPSLCRSHV